MKGEFDDYLSFPFQQRISFKLICPYDESKNKTEYLSVSSDFYFFYLSKAGCIFIITVC